MKNKSLLFVIFLVFFVVLFDFSFGSLYNALYFSDKSIKQDRLIHSAIGTNEDLLVFGSSRAYHHYNPEVFEKELGLTCFNVGYGGQNIYYHLALLKSALERHTPKMVILDLIYIDYEVTSVQHDKEKLGVLLPFVHQSSILRETVLMRGKTEKIKLLSSIYPLNSKQLYMLRNNLTSARSDVNGYVGLSRAWDKPIETKDVKDVVIDQSKMNAIYEFINICIKNNIKLFVCVSPHYVDFKGATSYATLEKNIYQEFNINLLNFENDSNFIKDPQLFADPFHLNKKGAEMYSLKVAKIIKNQSVQNLDDRTK